MSIVRIGVFGFLTAFFSFFSWGLWHQNVVPAMRINTNYEETTCTVVRTGVDRHEKGTERSVQGRTLLGYTCYAVIKYSVASNEYERSAFDGGDGYFNLKTEAEEAIAAFQPGQSYPCWYDPLDPQRVVIVRRESYAGNFLGFGIATLLGVLCGVGFLHAFWLGCRQLWTNDVVPDNNVARCPNCSARLRTPDARQCFECGHDWHAQ